MTSPSHAPHRFAFATDLDRTLTGADLVPDATALHAIARLRQRGHPALLVTGRPAADLQRHARLASSFDGFVLEGGAVWGTWNQFHGADNAALAVEAGRGLARAHAGVQVRTASFTAPVAMQALIQREHPDLALHANADQVDVLPPGHDKASGLARMLHALQCEDLPVVAVGDNDNDVPLLRAAHRGVTLSNGTPAVRAVADRVMPGAGPMGVVQLIDDLLAGRWP